MTRTLIVALLLSSSASHAQECTRVVVSVGACSESATESAPESREVIERDPSPVAQPVPQHTQQRYLEVVPQHVVPQYRDPQVEHSQYQLRRVGERDLPAGVHDEIRNLYLQRPSLGGPISLLAVGGAAAVIAVLVATDEPRECFSCLEEEDESTPGFVYGVLALGAAVIVAGIAWLVRRVRQRQVVNLRIRELRSGLRW